MSAKWQIYAVLICNIYVRSRIERLCNALEATRLSAYVRSRIERSCNALVAARHKGNALVPDYLFTWSLFLVRASIAGRLHSYVHHTCVSNSLVVGLTDLA